MRISVIGTGYLGAVHAACMAELGHEVLGVDNDAQKIAALADGRAPFYEPGLSEMLVRMVGSGKLLVQYVAGRGGGVRRHSLHLCGHSSAARFAGRRPQPHRSRDRRAGRESGP